MFDRPSSWVGAAYNCQLAITGSIATRRCFTIELKTVHRGEQEFAPVPGNNEGRWRNHRPFFARRGENWRTGNPAGLSSGIFGFELQRRWVPNVVKNRTIHRSSLWDSQPFTPLCFLPKSYAIDGVSHWRAADRLLHWPQKIGFRDRKCLLAIDLDPLGTFWKQNFSKNAAA